ncbi:hypothetical protein FQZ97_686290 [compost metagenome]
MHRQAQAEGFAHQRKPLRGAQAAPVVVVTQHDLHRATHLRVAAEFLQVGDHHVGGQRHVAGFRHGLHAVQAGGRVFVVLQHAAQLLHHLQAGGHGPVAVGVDAQRCARKGLSQGQQASGFLVGWERAGLELDALEAVLTDHAARLRHQLLGRERLAPGVGCVGLLDVFCVLVEQVGAEGHALARSAAQQVHDRRVGELALQVHHRHFKGADHLGYGFGDVGARCQRNLDTEELRRGLPGRDQRGDTHFHVVECPGRETRERRCGLGHRFEHGQVAVALVDADQAGVGLDLDDRAQRPGLVDAGGVEQRWIAECDRRDTDVSDGVGGHRRDVLKRRDQGASTVCGSHSEMAGR